jgi:hypothetical protein
MFAVFSRVTGKIVSVLQLAIKRCWDGCLIGFRPAETVAAIGNISSQPACIEFSLGVVIVRENEDEKMGDIGKTVPNDMTETK